MKNKVVIKLTIEEKKFLKNKEILTKLEKKSLNLNYNNKNLLKNKIRNI